MEKARETGKKVKRYSKEYKVEAVKLAERIGNKQAALELVVSASTLSTWKAEVLFVTLIYDRILTLNEPKKFHSSQISQ